MAVTSADTPEATHAPAAGSTTAVSDPDLLSEVIGVDIGGSGVKAAVVATADGDLVSDRVRLETPHPATPDAVAATVAAVVDQVDHRGPIGLTVPAVVRRGVVRTAANIDPAWVGTHAVNLFEGALGRRCVVLNDADAAGIAEMRFGAGRGRSGVVVIATLGTGIGTAVFSEGVLVPNTELGHLELKGGDAEKYAASSIRESEDLSWHHWGHRVGRYFALLERLLWPELIIVGGGVSKKFDKYSEFVLEKMDGHSEVVPAESLNQAGIVGAALAAAAPPADIGSGSADARAGS